MLKKLYTYFEEIFCCSCVALMIFCLTLQVGIRVVSGSSLAWTEELSRYAFIWAVFSGLPLGAKHLAHVRITAQFLPASIPTRLFFRMLADFLLVTLSLFIAYQSIPILIEGFQYPEMSPTLGIKKVWMEMIIPAGFLLMVYRVIEMYIVLWKKGTLYTLVETKGE